MFKNPRTLWFVFFLAGLLFLMGLEQMLHLNPILYICLIALLILAYTYITFWMKKDKE